MTRQVFVGDVVIGGDAPVSIQSMSNIDTKNVQEVLRQIDEMRDAGCQIMRLAVPDIEAASAFGQIKEKSSLPLVADIHFDYKGSGCSEGKKNSHTNRSEFRIFGKEYTAKIRWSNSERNG